MVLSGTKKLKLPRSIWKNYKRIFTAENSELIQNHKEENYFMVFVPSKQTLHFTLIKYQDD